MIRKCTSRWGSVFVSGMSFFTRADAVKSIPTPQGRKEAPQNSVGGKILEIEFANLKEFKFNFFKILKNSQKYKISKFQLIRFIIISGVDNCVFYPFNENPDEFIILYSNLNFIKISGVLEKFGIKISQIDIEQSDCSSLPPYILSKAVEFTLSCALVEGGSWVHIGKHMDCLCMSDVLKSAEENSLNLPVVQIRSNELNQIKLIPTVHKFFPLKSACAFPTSAVTLPNQSICQCVRGISDYNQLPVGMRSLEGLRDYWLLHHGFRLPDGDVKMVEIMFNGGLRLTYPINCVWKSKWCSLPNQSRIYSDQILQKIENEILKILNEKFDKFEILLNGKKILKNSETPRNKKQRKN